MGGVNPPPDPRPSEPLDCRSEISLDVIRDIFITFEGCIGFYVLVNGLIQIIVAEGFDTNEAASHMPHKYGGLKVCYIDQTIEPTMVPTQTQTPQTPQSSTPTGPPSSVLNTLWYSRPATTPLVSIL